MKPPVNCTVKITRSPYFPLWFAVLSTLSRQSMRPRFWTVSPGLQIRVWHLPDNCWSLPFLRRLALKFQLFCIVWLILMLTSNVFSLIPVCHCNWWEVNQSGQMLQWQQHLFCTFYVIANLWQTESMGIFLHKLHHMPCEMTSSFVPSPSVLNIWRCGGLTALDLSWW